MADSKGNDFNMMKNTTRHLLISIFLATVLFFCVSEGFAQAGGLHIEVTGLRNDKGKVLISIYNSAKGFPETVTDAVFKAAAKLKNGKAIFNIENVKPGDYAVAVLHDENENEKMDMRVIGLPKEGYGFSKNLMGIFGPPSFKKASFKFPGEKQIIIKIRY